MAIAILALGGRCQGIKHPQEVSGNQLGLHAVGAGQALGARYQGPTGSPPNTPPADSVRDFHSAALTGRSARNRRPPMTYSPPSGRPREVQPGSESSWR